METEALYAHRFSRAQELEKARIWKILVRDFFQRFVAKTDTVLDLGCGYGEFINNIEATRRIGVDGNQRVREHVAPQVEMHVRDVTDLGFLEPESVDVVFTSNLLEHLPNKVAIERLVREVSRVLRNGGRFILLGPNARLVPGDYWDFWDHHVPLTERSLSEALVLGGFAIEECVPAFLPYSTQSRLPQWSFLIRVYLKLRAAWPLFGKQFLIVTRKN